VGEKTVQVVGGLFGDRVASVTSGVGVAVFVGKALQGLKVQLLEAAIGLSWIRKRNELSDTPSTDQTLDLHRLREELSSHHYFP
jgi:hypothetical protein